MGTPSTELPSSLERRGKPRISCSYPAVVRGQHASGEKFVTRAVLTNMSSSGMYLRTKHNLQPGETLYVVVRMSTSSLAQDTVPVIAASGCVTRVEPHTGGVYGVAIQLSSHKFI